MVVWGGEDGEEGRERGGRVGWLGVVGVGGVVVVGWLVDSGCWLVVGSGGCWLLLVVVWLLEWWLSDGWEEAPPHFIAHTTRCRSSKS